MPPIVPQGFFPCRVFVRGHPVTCKWVTWRSALGSLLPLFHQRAFFSAATEQASTAAAFFGETPQRVVQDPLPEPNLFRDALRVPDCRLALTVVNQFRK